MKHLARLFPILLLMSFAAKAETQYITDVFEVTMRTGPSTSNGIVRLLKSGEPVNVIEYDDLTKYSLVETAENKQGYVLARYLVAQPSAKERLQNMTSEFDQQTTQLNQLSFEVDNLKSRLTQSESDNEALKQALLASENELSTIRDAAENTLNIVEQNRQLEAVVTELRRDKNKLTAENEVLSSSVEMEWFIRGAAVFLLAFLVGIAVTRIRWRKKESWGSY